MLATSAVQVWYLAHETVPAHPGPLSWHALAELFGRKFFAGLFVPMSIDGVRARVLFVAYIAALGFLIYQGRPKRTFVCSALALHALVLLATALRFKQDVMGLIPPLNGPRYVFIPNVMFVWCLLATYQHAKGLPRGVISLALASCLVTSFSSGFSSEPLPDYHWRDASRLLGGPDRVRIQINPDEPKDVWVIEVGAGERRKRP
jgi:hypothetical protein